VQQEQAVHLLFVVWPRVSCCHAGLTWNNTEGYIDWNHGDAGRGRPTSSAKGMVPAAVLNGVVDHTRRQGGRIARVSAIRTHPC
jgi:hypothetical protein